ncbi:hypothetical protein ONZ51_g2903 [Trametes cubensis]|uniref:Uncharacterized protein n=1 Tax=Trametes cubensis TaxID=1111947 RepID=A0AAD7TZC8_9APHY|nr:hypothetical protein ONZ51_g2903 [Trametes cubensis]
MQLISMLSGTHPSMLAVLPDPPSDPAAEPGLEEHEDDPEVPAEQVLRRGHREERARDRRPDRAREGLRELCEPVRRPQGGGAWGVVSGEDHDDAEVHPVSVCIAGRHSEKEAGLRERKAAQAGQEQDRRNGRPLARRRLPKRLLSLATQERWRVGALRDEGRERHCGEGRDPREHAEVEHGERAEAPQERGHAELERDRYCAHRGERAADLGGL